MINASLNFNLILTRKKVWKERSVAVGVYLIRDSTPMKEGVDLGSQLYI